MTDTDESQFASGQIRTFRAATSLIRLAGIAILIAIMLVLSTTAYYSYRYFINQKEAKASAIFDKARETLDEQASALKEYHFRLITWHFNDPALRVEPGSGTFADFTQNDSVYKELKLIGQYDKYVGQFFTKKLVSFSLTPTSIELKRLLSVLYLTEESYLNQYIFTHTYLLDSKGEFIASVPRQDNLAVIVNILHMRQTFQDLTAKGAAWAILNLRDCQQCAEIALVTRINLPNKRLGYLISTQTISIINRMLGWQGYYAIATPNHLLYTQSEFDPSLITRDTPRVVKTDSTRIFHANTLIFKGKILIGRAFRTLPWILYYTPTAAKEWGLEWELTAIHLILYLIGLLLLFRLYKAGRRIIFEPTEHALYALQQYQDELAKRNAELSEANHTVVQAMSARSLFLAAMSHEIRTPLNGVIAMLDLLGREPLSQRQQHVYSLIKRSSDLLLNLIDEILDFTRIQSGKIQFAPEPTQLHPLFASIAEIFQAKVEQSGKPIDFLFKNTIASATTAVLDAFRLTQVINNLLANALKFTQSGVIRFECMMLPQAQPAELTLRIIDSGIGMTEEQIARVFQPFEQADAALTRQYGGSGLGLAICQGIIIQLGGSIVVESLFELGSTFTVRLPCQLLSLAAVAPAAEATTPLASCPISHRSKLDGKVLVVEDHPINQAVLGELLQELGVEMVLFGSAEEALIYIDNHCTHLAAILTDISLPGINGYELAAKIRQNRTYRTIPIIAISAHAFASDIERAKLEGFTGYLTKPISLVKLEAMLSDIAAAAGGDPMEEVSKPKDDSAAHFAEGFAPVNFTNFCRVFNGSATKLIAALEKFLECDQQDQQRLDTALDAADREQIRLIAHQMAGAALYLDAGYADHLQELEECALTATDEELTHYISRIVAYSRHVQAACRDYIAELN